MKSLLVILLLLIPSISIAEPFSNCDNSAMLLHLASIEAAISRSQRPVYVPVPVYIPVPVQREQYKSIPPRPSKELTDQQIEELSERLNNQLWENNNDD